MEKNIYELIVDQAKQNSDAIAIFSPGHQARSYNNLCQYIGYVIRKLRAQGICKNDRVAVMLPHAAEMAMTCLAVSTGAVCVPINPAYKISELRLYLKELNVKVLLGKFDKDSFILSIAEFLELSILDIEPGNTSNGVINSESDSIEFSGLADPAFILCTSGTTNKAKIVSLTHHNIVSAAKNMSAVLQLTSADCCLGIMPFFHIHGLSTIFSSLITGGSIVCCDFSVPSFYAALKTFRPTWYSAAPTMHQAIVQESNHYLDVIQQSRLRFIRSASAPMFPQVIQELEKVFAIPFIESYGMTEASPQITSNRLPPYKRKIGSVGQAVGVEIKIVNEQGTKVVPGAIGEITIRGTTVIHHYENATANENAFIDTWLRTGDLGYLDEDGYLFITDRVKDIINRGGEKISPWEIDKILSHHPDIANAISFAVPHATLGENIGAAVMLKAGVTKGEEKIAQEIRQFVSKHLAYFKVPQEIFFVSELPEIKYGKLQRAQVAAKINLVSDISVMEQKLMDIWNLVLEKSAPLLKTIFFQLGGNSLSATRVITRIAGEFDIALSLENIFERPTISGLVSFIQEHQTQKLPEATTTKGFATAKTPHKHFPLSFGQKRLWFIDQKDTGNSAYNVSASLHLFGALDTSLLEKALNEIRRRHQSLRTTFQIIDNKLQQVVEEFTPTVLPIIDLTQSLQQEQDARRLAFEEASCLFNLAKEPLFCTKLLRLNAQEHILLLTMHHIISDGWSVAILYQELGDIYRAFLTKEQIVPELPIQYRDFVLWQQQMMPTILETQLPYWKNKLKPSSLFMDIPTDYRRPLHQTYRGKKLCTSIPQDISSQLDSWSIEQEVTLFMTMLAAFKILLRRYTEQNEVVVGVPIANRKPVETEKVIGFFANTLVFQTDVSGNPSFQDFVSRVKSTAQEAYDHQDIPLEKLIEELDIKQDSSRSPLFQVMFAFQNLPDLNKPSFAHKSSYEWVDGDAFVLTPNLSACPFKIDNGSSKFDMTLYLEQTKKGVVCTWQYNSDIFNASTIARMDTQFQILLRNIAQNPDQNILDFPLLADEELAQMTTDIDFSTAIDSSQNFGSIFEKQVELMPDNLAVKYKDCELSYREVNDKANRLAHYLQDNEVKLGKTIGIFLDRSIEMVLAIIAVLKTGATYVPIDPTYPEERVSFILNDAHIDILLTQEFVASQIAKYPTTTKLICLDMQQQIIDQKSNKNSNKTIDSSGIAYIIYTSGSTGHPKGVMIPHSNLYHYVQAMQAAVNITPTDRYLHTASFAFSSSVRQLMLPLSCGAAVIIAASEQIKNPQLLFDLVCKSCISIIDIVPSYWRSCIQVLKCLPEETRKELRSSQLRLVLSASEALLPDIPYKWHSFFGNHVALINMYGQTETTGIVSTYNINASDFNAPKTISIGKAISTSKIYILDAFQKPVAVGIVGEIYIGGFGVGKGYLNLPQETKEKFIANPFGSSKNYLYRTGDSGRYRSDGNIEFCGRLDNQVKIRGIRCQPEEVILALQKHPDIKTAVVIPYNVGYNQKLAACIVKNTPDQNILNQVSLSSFLKEMLPEYMIPSLIQEVKVFPMTPSGKVDLSQLRQEIRPETQVHVAAKYIAPSTHVEKTLVKIWEQVLQVNRVSIADNFFDLGGDSILSIEVFLRANEEGLLLELKDIFKYPNIKDLAKVLSLSIEAPENIDDASISPSIIVKDKTAFVLVSVDSLRDYSCAILEGAGLSKQGAAIVTNVQLESSLREQPTHNIGDIPRYARRLAKGILNSTPDIRIIDETAISVKIDGDNAPGQWVATVAMETAIKKAQDSGVGMVAVRRSNHFGAAGHYAWLAASQGFIGICTTNGPLILAPTGGITPTLGNNPLAVGIPADKYYPILLDIAMSVAPRGKIGLQVAEGKSLSPGWILDHNGLPSTDIKDLAAGLGIPIGAHKGYGLALVLEVLAGVLTGAGFGWDHSKQKRKNAQELDFGHFFMVIDPKLFMPQATFISRVDTMIEQAKKSKPITPGKEILIPGEIELKARAKNSKEGLPLPILVYETLLECAKKMGIETNLVILQK